MSKTAKQNCKQKPRLTITSIGGGILQDAGGSCAHIG